MEFLRYFLPRFTITVLSIAFVSTVVATWFIGLWWGIGFTAFALLLVSTIMVCINS